MTWVIEVYLCIRPRPIQLLHTTLGSGDMETDNESAFPEKHRDVLPVEGDFPEPDLDGPVGLDKYLRRKQEYSAPVVQLAQRQWPVDPPRGAGGEGGRAGRSENI